MKSRLLAAIAVLGLPSLVAAQPLMRPRTDSLHIDILRPYRLGQVLVTAERRPELGVTTVQSVPIGRIRATDAPTIDRVMSLVPAARVQTNSRGEAILYLRNAGERQTAIFFDGALVNVPWDNRVDLSLMPTNAIGGITVSKGVPSVLYGANTLGGAVELVSRELDLPGTLTSIDLIGGENGYYNVAAMHTGNLGSFNYIAALGQTRRDALPLPNLDDLRGRPEVPFDRHQASDETRVNTDSRVTNGFVRGRLRLGETSAVGLSVNLVDGAKGVAPEGHIEGARFWRYPEWSMMTVTANGDTKFGADDAWDLRGAAWFTNFGQTIDQFEDSTYSALSARQEDKDAVLGARVVLGYTPMEGTTVSVAANVLNATHEQVDYSADSAGLVAGPTQNYQQQNISGGLEVEHRAAENLTLTVGAGYDMMAMPKTGDKPERDPFSAVNLAAGARFKATEGLAVRATAGRRTRFPSMRELFGEALRRFLVNPDLKPEDATTIDLGFEFEDHSRRTGSEFHQSIGRVSVVGFASIVSNTIDQRNVTDTAGVRRRQRINLTGSRTYGVEVAGVLRALSPLQLEGHFTYMNSRGRLTAEADGVDSTFDLVEKPEYTGTLILSYDTPFGLRPEVELLLNGDAKGLTEDNELVSLGSSAILNARLAYNIPLTSLTASSMLQVFVRMNNITDALYLPQLGLPAPGRELQGGVKMTF